MRLKSAIFKNLKPIYRSSGKKEIFIDFTKCTHQIILVVGKNGSGKSTIINALQPLPESPSLYLDGESGQKIIEYFFEDLIYRLTINYPVNGMKQRTVTKAYLTKIMPDGTEMELNPNGNIGSYKDALYSEFKLDPNFISLTQLSMEDRGIVERSPSERKKYISAILEEVQEYNDMHKTLTKRSSIFKSMVNNITAKINSIGDKDVLEHQLESLNNNISTIEMNIEKCNSTISSINAMIQMMDPDGKIQERYAMLNSDLVRINGHIKDLDIVLSKYNSKYPDMSSIVNEIEEQKTLLQDFVIELQTTKDRLSDYLLSREEDYKIIQLKKQKLDALRSDFVFDDLKSSISALRKNIIQYESIFDRIGINGLSITKNEYIIGLNTLKDVKESIMNMRSYANLSDIEKAIHCYLNGTDIIQEKKQIEEQIKEKESKLETYRARKSYYLGIKETAKILNKRPSSCNITECPFIFNALEASRQEPENNIRVLENLITEKEEQLEDLHRNLNDLDILAQTYQMLYNIIRSINNNSSIISKLPIGHLFIDTNRFLSELMNGSNFNEINELYDYIQYANIFELYKSDKEKLTKLEYDYKLYESKISIIEDIGNELKELQEKLNKAEEIISTHQSRIYGLNKKIAEKENKLQTLNRLKEMYQERNDSEDKKSQIENNINSIMIDMKQIEDKIIIMNQSNQNLIRLKSDLKPLCEERDKIRFNLTKLEEYYKELDHYNGKYQIVELIKKYSSPTSGIQTLFIKLYMGKTLEITNELLSYLFRGELELLPYIINESEFRIPCKNTNSSVVNDDISSCSSAEKSMISMILSFALLNQSSTKYNILKMDEMDGPLDQYNRTHFLTVLRIIMEKLEVENCLMVSHSSEIDMSDVDIILLSETNDYGYDENVIFKF